MNQPNLFHYATKELSQDAVICWLIACASTGEGNLHEVGRSFVRALFQAGSIGGGTVPVVNPETRRTEVHTGPCTVDEVGLPERQSGRQGRKDVYFQARVDRKLVSFVVEDKVDSGPHDNQLSKYLDDVTSDDQKEDIIKPIYFKTGFVFDDERRLVEDAQYCVFQLEDLVSCLKGHCEPTSNDVLIQYFEHVGRQLRDRNRAMLEWDLSYDFVQWEFLKSVSNRIETGRDHWKSLLPQQLANPGVPELPHMLHGRSVGGAAWTQYWFSQHLYWRLDSGKPMRLMVNLPATEWNDVQLSFYRDSFEVAREMLGEVDCGGSRRKSGNDVLVGSVALDRCGANELVEPIVRLHQKSLELGSLWDVMGRVASRCWPDGGETQVNYEWGRLGFHARSSWSDYENWTPALFVGVLLDGHEHRTTPMDPELGPDACVLLCVAERLQPADEHPGYRQLVEYLKDVQLPEGWQFYDHLNDERVKNDGPNHWHPFHVRCPLAKVLERATTLEEKANRFYADVRGIVDTILNHPSLHTSWT